MKRYLYLRNELILETPAPLQQEGASLLTVLSDGQSYYLPREAIFFGDSAPCQLIFPGKDLFAVLSPEGEFSLYRGEVYRNGRKLETGSVRLETGDKLFFGTALLCYRGDTLLLCGKDVLCSLPPCLAGSKLPPGFPLYDRSPRRLPPPIQKSIELLRPENLPEAQRGEQLRRLLMPLGTVLVMGGTAFALGRASMFALSGGTVLLTVCFAVIALLQGKKTAKARMAERAEGYAAYLLRMQKRFFSLREQSIRAARLTAPETRELLLMAERYAPRIYERSPRDADFMCLVLGRQRQAAPYAIRFSEQETRRERDPLCLEALALKREFETLPDMPVFVNLRESQLGILGAPELCRVVLSNYLFRLCFFQSYRDLSIILLCRAADSALRSAFSWCPQFEGKDFRCSGILSYTQEAETVLGGLLQQIKERKRKAGEEKKSGYFLPQYLLVAEDASLLAGHSLLSYLDETSPELGISLIYCAERREQLPESVKTIVSVEGGGEGLLCLRNGLIATERLRLELPDAVAIERAARRLAGLFHRRDTSEELPEKLGFLELFRVESPEELQIAARWKKNRAADGLAAPLGVRTAAETVCLDLHESAHGPHALVAGTTGSGKSELLQSLILSLALQFSPEEVGFLLIDYKGGGMANLFAELPHLLGTITNLDGSDSYRALVAVKSELARRQRLFRELGVNHIDDYGEVYRAGRTGVPLPHLFLIADEFAELKAEQPEFMAELISTARVGRSLGVHLILATQKPSGVVNEQIWSNARCKIALKVQTEADSKEMLKTGDAAQLTRPGRAYLQVGNNELYELFQSAYSGAAYRRAGEAADRRIYRRTARGQRELLCRAGRSETAAREELSELGAVLREICRVAAVEALKLPEKLWLPPLPAMLELPAAESGVADETESLAFPLGCADIPEEQRTEICTHDFRRDGNFAVFGAGGMGKSTVLQTAAIALAERYPPSRVYFYLLDFGAGALSLVRGLPHVADYLNFDETEKRKKLMALLTAEVKRRKLSEAAEQETAIVLFLDHFDAVKELEPELEPFFMQLARDGAAVGIYMALTATRPGALRYSLLNHIKDKIALFLLDPSEAAEAVGRSPLKLPEIKGRALVQRDGIHFLQCYRASAAEKKDYDTAIRARCEACARKAMGWRPTPLAVMPEVLTPDLLWERYAAVRQPFSYAAGLDTAEVSPRTLCLYGNLNLILGRAQCGKTNLLLLLHAAYAGQSYVIDCGGDLYPLAKEGDAHYADDAASLTALGELLEAEIKQRRASYENSGKTLRMREYFRQEKELALWIDGAERFSALCQSKTAWWENLLRAAMEVGIAIVATAASPRFSSYDGVSKLLKEAQSGVVFGPPDEQTVFRVSGYRPKPPRVEIALLIAKGQVSEIQIPLALPLL